MSGLALVAKALGAEVTGSTSRTRPTARGSGRRGSSRRSATMPPTCPRAQRWWSPRRYRRTTRRWRPRAGCSTGDLLGEVSRLKRAIAISGTHGKTTTASMAAHVLRECGRDPGFLIGASPLRRNERRLGLGRLGGGRGRRVRPFLPEARARGGRGDQHRAGPPRHLLARRAGGGLRRLRGSGGVQVLGPGGPPGRLGSGPLRSGGRGGPGTAAARVALCGGAPDRADRPRRAQRPQCARRPGGLSPGGRRAGRGGAGAARLRRRRTALRGPRQYALGRARLRRLRPPSDRGGRDP